MYTPPQQETDRFKAGRSAVLPQNRSFLFQMPNELPQNRRCLPDVYPMSTRRNARGARAYWFFAPLRRPPGGLPFSNVKKLRNACCAGALRLFPVPDAGDMVSPKRRNFRFFQLAAQSGRGFPFARAAPKPPETALRQRKNGTGERKFQKGE